MKPKIRSVQRHKSISALNQFSDDFGMKLGKELIYILATRDNPDVGGDDWEQIFARCIGVEWKKSNSGLEDVVCDKMAWSAKTIKNANPFTHRHIRLITGRNSLDYSYEVDAVRRKDPNEVGEMVLGIWNARYDKVAENFSDLRTVVLIRDDELRDFAVLEIPTRRFDPKDYTWEWNHKKNLEGYEKGTDIHRFTWQPHGAQFTMLPAVPLERLKIRIKRPPMISHKYVLDEIKFDRSWVEIIK